MKVTYPSNPSTHYKPHARSVTEYTWYRFRNMHALYLAHELGSVLLVLLLFIEALQEACVGSLYVVGDELLYNAGDLLSHLLKLLFGEVGHYLGAAYPLHPPMEALVQGSEGETHDSYELKPVLVGVLQEPPELFQGILASLDPVLVHFGFTANSEKGFHLNIWVRAHP